MAKGGEFILPDNDFSGIFTVSDFTEDHSLVWQMMAEFMDKEVLNKHACERIESKDLPFIYQLMKKAAVELGIVGAEIPEEFGGSEMDKISTAIIAEWIGRQGSYACTFLAHTGIGTLPIKLFGTKTQKEKYLPKLASAEWMAAYSLTEAGAGSDANSAKSTALRVEGGYRLNGSKIFVTNGGMATVFTVFSKLDGKLTAFIIEKDFEGVEVGNEDHKLGIQGSSTTPLNLNNVFVPAENLLGEEGKGFKIAMKVLNLGRFKLGAACLGGARLCLKEALEYSKTRKQFGTHIGSFGAIQRVLVVMAAKIYGMESMVYRTAGYLDDMTRNIDPNDQEALLAAIDEFVIECSLIKVRCSEFMFEIAGDNLGVHGGNGFMKEYAAERHLRDAVINRIFEGTNPINSLVAIGMALKKAMKNELPLITEGKKIFAESMAPSMAIESDDLVEKLGGYLKNAKKSVILAAGAAVEKHGAKLNDAMTNPYIQNLLLNLADCLGVIFLLESSLAALSKNRTEHNENLVRVLFTQQLFELERLMRETLPMCGEGDTLRTMLAMSRRFLKYTPDDLADLYTKIASNLK